MRTVAEYVGALERAEAAQVQMGRADMTPAEMIERARREGIPPRLVRGAKMLGESWRGGGRCALGWSALCSCPAPSEFCELKSSWVELVLDHAGLNREAFDTVATLDPEDAAWVILSMSIREFKASGITIVVRSPEWIRRTYREIRTDDAPSELEDLLFGSQGTKLDLTWPSLLEAIATADNAEDATTAWLVTAHTFMVMRSAADADQRKKHRYEQ